MNYFQVVMLLSQGVLVSFLILMLFYLRKKLGIGILFACLGLFQFMQVFLSSTFYVELAKNFLVSPGSTVLFTASLFAVLIIYIKEDASETRKIIYALMITNIIMSILILSFGWNFKESFTYNPYNVSSNFFVNNSWILFIGTIALLFDSLLIIIIYEFFSRHLSNLFLQICLTMLIVVSFDTAFFSTIAFWNYDNFHAIFMSGLISKGVFAIFYSVIFSFYLKYIDTWGLKTDKFKINDVFKPLSYRQKFEIAKHNVIKTFEEAKLQEIKYQTLTNSSPVGIFHTRSDGYTTFVNPKWCEISGLSMDEALGNGWLKAVHPDDIEPIKMEWEMATAQKRTSETQYRFLLNDGSIKWVLGRAVPEINDQNQIIGYIGTITDITKIKFYQQEQIVLKEKAESIEIHLKTIINTLPDLIWLKDVNGVYLSCNHRFEDFFGANEYEIIGKTDYDFTTKELADFFRANDKAAMQADKPSINEEEVTFAIDNHKEYLETIKTPLYNSNNQLIGVLGIARNITYRKKHEKELTQAKEKAEESDRLKTAFLANISHEIRTPMNGILGFAGLLKEPHLTDEEQQNYIQIIEKSGARMLNIINDIVSISEIESGTMNIHLTETNINSQCQVVYDVLKHNADYKGLHLFFSPTLPENEAVVKTDSEKFTSIMSNLVKNAIKYTDKGTIEFGYIKKDEEFEFYVKDTGIGIPKEKQDAVFERFIQADLVDRMARQGAGLGLAISKAFVEMLGGKIWVKSEEGKGSTFFFTIPCNAHSNEESDKLSKIHDYKTKPVISEISGLKVLIVEDDKESVFLFSIEMRKISKEVFKATNGLEAIEICRKHPDIDLVLMDLQMPEMNGYQATREIRKFNQKVIIIAQSAFVYTSDKEEAIEAGCNNHISKPIKQDELMSLIQSYFAK